MKAHSNNFKNYSMMFGKQIDSIITYDLEGTRRILGVEELNGITPHFEGDILKSVMKELDIDSNVDIPIGTEINYKYGVMVDDSFEYLDFGNYIVYSSEYKADTLSYDIVCYDKMLYSMYDYEPLEVIYPITVRDYISELAYKLGLNFKNNTDTFTNYDQEIKSELYANIGYTYRDVLDELAQVVGGAICIDKDDNLEIRYPVETDDVINEDVFNDTNVTIGKKYGPINSIVLSRAGGADNIYKSDEESIELNGLCELKIQDNQILNGDDRARYLDEIFERLNGLEYYTYNFDTQGIAYYDFLDKFTSEIYGEQYPCLVLNDELNVTQGVSEHLFVEEPEETETEYKYESSTDQAINQAYIIAKKSEAEIEALARQVTDLTTKITANDYIEIEDGSVNKPVELRINGNFKIQGDNNLIIEDKDENLRKVLLPFNKLNYLNVNCYDEFVLKNGDAKLVKRVKPEIDEDLIVGNDYSGKTIKINIPDKTIFERHTDYASFLFTFENGAIVLSSNYQYSGSCNVYYLSNDGQFNEIYNYNFDEDFMSINLKEFTIPSDAGILREKNVVETIEDTTILASSLFRNYEPAHPLPSPIEQDLGKIEFDLNDGYNLIYLEKVANAHYYMEYRHKTIFSDIYATKVEMTSAINVSAGNIIQSVNAKFEAVDGEIEDINGTLELKIDKNDNNQVVSMINASANEINLKSNRFSMESDYSKITKNGTVEFKGGTIAGWTLSTEQLSNGQYFLNKNGYARIYTYADMVLIRNYMLGKIDFSQNDIDYYDMNGDGQVGSYELNLLRQKILGY